jgi:hypothetical protein
VRWNTQSTTPDGTNTHHYRNSIVSYRRPYKIYSYSTPIPVTISNDAYWGATGSLGKGNWVQGQGPAVQLTEVDFGTNAELVGTARDDHAGLVGAEVIER